MAVSMITLPKTNAIPLRYLAFLLGLPTSGRKVDIQTLLTRRLDDAPPPPGFQQIVSIDMGVRNLGVCVLSAPHLVKSDTVKESEQPAHTTQSPLKVLAWRKIDVMQHLAVRRGPRFSDSSDTPTEYKETLKALKRKDDSPIAADFTPGNLARAAHSIVSTLLMEYKPSVFLIERQRFRTGGNSAVQEWTLRVNLLEHMIWNCLETLRTEAGGCSGSELVNAAGTLAGVHEVSPAKVAKFWCGGLPQDLGPEGPAAVPLRVGRPQQVKIKKVDKVAVARRWVGEWSNNTQSGNVRLEFADEAVETAKAFLPKDGERKTRRKKATVAAENDEPIGKLDDLADSLLQGVAWVKWEENRRKLAKMVVRD